MGNGIISEQCIVSNLKARGIDHLGPLKTETFRNMILVELHNSPNDKTIDNLENWYTESKESNRLIFTVQVRFGFNSCGFKFWFSSG